MMRRISTTAISTILAMSCIAAAFSTPAQAGDREARIAAGIFLGILGTALVASEVKKKRKRHKKYAHRHNPHNVYDDDIYVEPRHRRRARENRRASRWERHVRRCYRKYRTYDEFSDTFIDNRGRERLCRL